MKRADITKPSKRDNEACKVATGYSLPVVARYQSFQSFISDMAEIDDAIKSNVLSMSSPDFHGAASWEDAIQLARNGDAKGAELAKQHMERLSDKGLFSYGQASIGLDVVGFAPCVPAYLVGHPESMLAKAEAIGLGTPIRVFAGIGAGSWVSTDQMIERGVALAALVLALSTMRPVELYAFTHAVNGHTSRGGICVWPVETRPLDLTSVAHQISHPSIHRLYAFAGADALHKKPAHDRPLPCDGYRDNIEQQARIALGAEAHDVVIPRATHGTDDPLISRPFEWLDEVLATHIAEYMPTA